MSDCGCHGGSSLAGLGYPGNASSVLTALDERLERVTGRVEAAYAAHSITDAQLDAYRPKLDAIGQKINALADHALTDEAFIATQRTAADELAALERVFGIDVANSQTADNTKKWLLIGAGSFVAVLAVLGIGYGITKLRFVHEGHRSLRGLGRGRRRRRSRR